MRERSMFMPYERKGAKTRLAKYIGCSKAYVTQMFNGSRPPSLDAAAKLEVYFIRVGIPVTRWDMLYGREKGEGIDHLVRRVIEEKKQKAEKHAPARIPSLLK